MAEDRNQTIKKQLLKKREDNARRKVPLAPGEMVDDALARGADGATRWLQKNFGVLQWALVAALVGGVGYGVYDYRANKRAEAASGSLIKAVSSERGRISSTQAKPDEDGVEDPTPVFKSAEERRDTALASYRKVTSTYPGTGAAILARLGEAGLLLDKRDWDGANQAYGDVKASALSTADVMVRGRALEGIGLALEGKGDLDGALKAFRELENTDTRGLKELGMYHQARILFAKGETDKPRELLKGARERLKGTASPSNAGPLGESHPFQFLESQVDDLLRRVDPSAIPAPTAPAPGGGSGITPEQLQQLQEQLSKHKEAPPAPAGSH